MKRRYFNLMFLVLVCLAMVLFTGDNLENIKQVFGIGGKAEDKKTVIVIDAGHPSTSLGTENKVLMGT